MAGSDLILSGLFVAGILISLTADFRLRNAAAASLTTSCITAAGAGLVFLACAAAIR
ncbi:hypothetical protein [Methylobacterium longum]|jgi:hypothetical protein|uniref:hypothetical protein n=1 Tax=Methylobacterium longum TaxID=767694 RepID=UPI001EE38002|nr:hypothetical protein [Methylobacterium longum]